MLGVMQAKSAIGGQQTIDAVMDKGMFICGSPETVRQKLSEYHGEIGFGHLLSLLQFGTLPAELTRKSMELYATEVIPYLRANAAGKVAEAAE
jgi:alkanesulfonate monooxygenase SsuD/methylene tetrahydromethanopterin reductase-like flavin-dependent oxidoreductase (luciferase family)